MHLKRNLQNDVITTEFKKFLDVEMKTMRRESVTFSQKDDRLDDFYFKVLSVFEIQRFVVCR